MTYSKKYLDYDYVFLKEITELFISNLTDLNEGLIVGIKTNDPGQYFRKFYKARFSLNLIENENLLSKAELICEIIQVTSIDKLDMFLVNSFRNVCHQEIENLSSRLKYYEKYLVRPAELS